MLPIKWSYLTFQPLHHAFNPLILFFFFFAPSKSKISPAFLTLATEKNVHLSLVIHPRKEQDDTLLNVSSVFGTAKATQEADNVVILQRAEGKKMVDVRKNRFDGDLGSFQIVFDQDTHLYRDELSSGGNLEIGKNSNDAARNSKSGNMETNDKSNQSQEVVLDEVIMS